MLIRLYAGTSGARACNIEYCGPVASAELTENVLLPEIEEADTPLEQFACDSATPAEAAAL